jgi:hypothetical protein
MFVVQNKNLFPTNIQNQNIDTGQRNNLYLPQANLTIYNLYLPQANLTIYQKGAIIRGYIFLIIYPWRLRMSPGIKKSLKLL